MGEGDRPRLSGRRRIGGEHGLGQLVPARQVDRHGGLLVGDEDLGIAFAPRPPGAGDVGPRWADHGVARS